MRTVLAHIVLISLMPISAVGDEGWTTETVDTEGDTGWFTSLALDSSDNPHIAYTDYSNYALKYAYWNGSAWEVETVDSSSAVTGMQPSIAVDSNDNPHISYYDDYNDKLKYAVSDGSNWAIVIVDNDEDTGWYNSLVLDSNDDPHIAYRRYVYPDYTLKYAKWTDKGWNIETVDGPPDWVGWHCSLALDSSENPRIAHYDWATGDLRYTSYSGSWSTVVIDDEGDVGGLCSIAIDSSDNTHISYCDWTNDDLKYTYWSGTDWVIQSIDTDGNVGEYTSLALDSSDNPHISYYDDTSGDLKYTSWTGSAWDIETVETSGDAGEHTSLALDSGEKPHISYYKRSGGDLKYAFYGPIGIDDDGGNNPANPEAFALHPAAPNPSSGIANIGFVLPHTCEIELSIYDIKGRKIATPAEGIHQPGEFSAEVSGLSSGVYIYELIADEFSGSKKMVVK